MCVSNQRPIAFWVCLDASTITTSAFAYSANDKLIVLSCSGYRAP